MTPMLQALGLPLYVFMLTRHVTLIFGILLGHDTAAKNPMGFIFVICVVVGSQNILNPELDATCGAEALLGKPR